VPSFWRRDPYWQETLAWDLALESWPAPQPERAEPWIPSGLRTLDLGERAIGRRWVAYPFYGYRRDVGFGPAALWIRFGSEWDTEDPAPLGIPYSELTTTDESCKFGFRSNPYWRLGLTEDAAETLRTKLEATG
jgi:hypothetical protein